MSTVEKRSHVTIAEYLAYDDSIEGKSEYYDGEIFNMAGGTKPHAAITANAIIALGNALADSPCIVYSPDLKVYIEAANAIVYPDVQVIGDEAEASDLREDIFTNPTIIVEVLSPTTAAFDRSFKFQRYMTLPSLQEYVLIEQERIQIDVFERADDGEWKFRTYTELDQVIHFSSIAASVRVASIYAKVRFPYSSLR